MYKLKLHQFHVNFDQIQIKFGGHYSELGQKCNMEIELLQGIISGLSQQVSGQSGDCQGSIETKGV